MDREVVVMGERSSCCCGCPFCISSSRTHQRAQSRTPEAGTGAEYTTRTSEHLIWNSVWETLQGDGMPEYLQQPNCRKYSEL